MASIRRRQQREIFKKSDFIKIKNQLPRFSQLAKDWYSARRREGEDKFNQFALESADRLEQQRGERYNFAKEVWLNWGFNDSEIKMLEESWSLLIDPENWRESKRKARELSKQAMQSKLERLKN